MKFVYLKDVVSLKLDGEKCIGCGMCLTVCPHSVFSLENKKAVITNKDACMECGACAKNCAVDAIRVKAGVGCAFAILMSKLKVKNACCNVDCGCSQDT